MGGPTSSIRYRQHSCWDHVTTQAPPLRQSRDTFGGLFITKSGCVYCAVRTTFLNIIRAQFGLYQSHLRTQWILTCEMSEYLWRNTAIGHCWTQSKGNHSPQTRISLFFSFLFFFLPAVTKIPISIRTSACHSVYLVQLTRSHGLLLRHPQ
jgi:hypothetical protein